MQLLAVKYRGQGQGGRLFTDGEHVNTFGFAFSVGIDPDFAFTAVCQKEVVGIGGENVCGTVGQGVLGVFWKPEMGLGAPPQLIREVRVKDATLTGGSIRVNPLQEGFAVGFRGGDRFQR